MKKLFLLYTFLLISANLCRAQEWFTNLDVAKRLAHVQDKMLFVIWEESLDYAYPLTYVSNSGNLVFMDLSKDEDIDKVIWEHFIPVLLQESEYDKLIKEAEGRGLKYITKLNDDSIKIMDANKNILNVKSYFEYEQNLSEIIKKYSLKTTFIKQDLINYSKYRNFTTTFNLGSKYIDFALFVEKETRAEIIDLANIYFDKAKNHIVTDSIENRMAYSQRIDLLMIKEDLVLDKARRALRFLKRIDKSEIAEVNLVLYNFLNYTAFKLLKDEKNVALIEDQISTVNLKKAELIFNINN